MSTDEATVALPLRVAVTDDHPPAAPFPRRDTRVILFPKWLYIKDRHGRYLSVRSGPIYSTLTFRQLGDPDLDCAFETSGTFPEWYNLRGRNGNHIQRYYNDWYSADNGGIPGFNAITTTGNRAYLRDNYGPSRFLSSDLTDSGAPIARDYLNDSSLLEILQAAIKNEISDVNYDINGARVREAVPLIALSTSVRNDSDGDVNQTLSYTYEKWSVGTWNNSAGVEIGSTMTFRAGVPFVSSAEFEISVSASYSHEWGGEEGQRQIVTSSTTVTVPPRKRARATIIIRNAQLDIGFTYTQDILWANGQTEKSVKTGIYNNVDSWHIDVALDNWEDI